MAIEMRRLVNYHVIIFLNLICEDHLAIMITAKGIAPHSTIFIGMRFMRDWLATLRLAFVEAFSR